MSVRIVTHKNQTSIYLPKKDVDILKCVLSKIKVLQHYTLSYVQNRFIIKYPLSQYHKTKIINAFKAEEIRKKELKIIRGFKGCLITGYGFEWM